MIVWVLLTGLFVGAAVACAVGWWLERAQTAIQRSIIERLLDRVQAADLGQFHAFQNLEPRPPQPARKVYSNPSGLIKFSEPIEADK